MLSELEYTLAVQGTGGNTFHQTRTVEVKSKTLSIFVQTDKATYKPSQQGNLMVRNYSSVKISPKSSVAELKRERFQLDFVLRFSVRCSR